MKIGVLKKYRFRAGIFLLLSAITSALFGLYIGRIVDVIGNSDYQKFLSTVLITGVIILSNTLFSMFGWRFAYADSCHKAEFLKNKIYRQEILKTRSQTIDISNFSSKIDLVFGDNFMNQWNIYNNILVFIFSSIAIITINWIMFFVAIIVSIIPMFVPALFNNYVQKAAKSYALESTSYLNNVSDTLQGRLEIVKYNVIEVFCKHHIHKNHKFEQKRLHNKVANYNAGSITETVGNSTFLILFLVGGLLTYNGFMEVGGVIGVIQLMNNVVRPIIQVASLRSEMNACKPVLLELNKEIETIASNEDVNTLSIDGDKFNLTVKDISFKYALNTENVIENFTYNFESGKKYLIRGESGSGKSTLAKLFTGELKPTNGNIKINGINIENIDSKSFSSLIRYVDQKSYIFKDTIYNNIDLFRNIDNKEILSIINELGLNELDINSVIDDDNGISGGQKSRISLARAVSKFPPILIIDEPTAALDTDNALKLMSFVCSLPIMTIVISHSNDDNVKALFDFIINVGKR